MHAYACVCVCVCVCVCNKMCVSVGLYRGTKLIEGGCFFLVKDKIAKHWKADRRWPLSPCESQEITKHWKAD